MKYKLLTFALLASTAAFAQYGGYRSSDPYGRGYGPGNRDGYRDNNRSGYANAQRSIDFIQTDLSRIGQRAAWDRWAVKQFTQAVDNLENFQLRAARGDFDRGRLDRAIDNLNRLLTAPELRMADKQRIASHRDQLRMIRARV